MTHIRTSSGSLERRGAIGCALAVEVAGLVYANALHNPFIYDDYRLIVENPALAAGDVSAMLLRDVTRPLVTISYALDRRLGGPSPLGFHVTNVALHMINVALFAALAWGIGRDRARLRPEIVAPIASLLFAVHPLMTEAVGYISGRSELLSATFFLTALLAARRALTGGRTTWMLAAVVAWLAALTCKETAVFFPVIVLLYDRLILAEGATERPSMRHVHVAMVSAAAILALARVAVFIWIEHARDVTFRFDLLWLEIDASRRYLTWLIAPAGQAIFHAVPMPSLGDWRPWLGAGLLVMFVAMGWRARRVHAAFLFGVSWFYLLLIPSAILVAMDRGEPVAEHRAYLASLGFFLIAGVALYRAMDWLRDRSALARPLAIAGVAILVLSLGGRTLIRNQLWSNPVLVWLEAAERAPDHWFPPLLLGEELHRAGQHDQAIAAYRKAIAARPSEPGPYGKLGLCLAELRDLEGAEEAFAKQRALAADSAEAANGLATVSLLRGDLAIARQRYLDTLVLDPPNIAARRGLAAIEEAPGGNPAEALRWCEDIRRLAPETPGNDDCIRRNQDRIRRR